MNILHFVWREHLRAVIWTSALSATPLFEGRFAVLAGKEWGLPMPISLLLAIASSVLPLMIMMPLSAPIRRLFNKSPDKIGGRALLGLFVFMALPLPGTGVWTGALIASILNISRPRAAAVIFFGNACACLIMSAVYFFVRTAL